MSAWPASTDIFINPGVFGPGPFQLVTQAEDPNIGRFVLPERIHQSSIRGTYKALFRLHGERVCPLCPQPG